MCFYLDKMLSVLKVPQSKIIVLFSRWGQEEFLGLTYLKFDSFFASKDTPDNSEEKATLAKFLPSSSYYRLLVTFAGTKRGAFTHVNISWGTISTPATQML